MGSRHVNTLDDTAHADWLDDALREAAQRHRAAYIADDGFTASTMARLPRSGELPPWRRPVVFLMWLLLGVATLVSLPGLFDQVFRNGVALVVGHRIGLIDIAVVLALVSTATWGGLVYAARVE